MKTTPKFNLGYFEYGDLTSSDVESNRWRTIDAQMYSLFDVLGNGVISGWDFVFSDANSYSLSVAPGKGHVGLVAVETTSVKKLSLNPGAKNYIYASKTTSSYYDKTVVFFVYTSPVNYANHLFLGYVETNPVTKLPSIISSNIDDRVYISFKQQILNAIKNHRHIGGGNNPSKINLATDVQGYLSYKNIEDLDASIIATGTLGIDRIPKIDHTSLTNIGSLTHAQLDTFAEILSYDGTRLMGETSSVNLLKMILALKHIYPTIDDYLVNEIAFIPGISDDSLVDQVNTTAEVDYRTSAEGGTHTIKGVPAQSSSYFSKKWYESTLLEGTFNNVAISGNAASLITREDRVYVENFQDISDWETLISDTSSISASFAIDNALSGSGKVTVDSDQASVSFVLKKTFSAQDWSGYDKIVFSFYCDNTTHGDIYFFIYDAISGSQNSYSLILEKNSPTINQDTLGIGWREINIDLSKFERKNITSVGFYTSTSSGWNIKDKMFFNVNDMFLSSGNLFLQNGAVTLKYGNGFQYNFDSLRWDSSLPSGTSIKARTRVSNSEDMSSSIWSDYLLSSGSKITLPSSNTYGYIEVEMNLQSDDTFISSPWLYSVTLDFVTLSSDFSFDFNTKEAWDSGSGLNIDSDSVVGGITIKSSSDLGSYIYGSDGVLKQMSGDFSNKLSVYGGLIPKSFGQMKNGKSQSFGQISAVSLGLRDSFFIADTDNDRVLEIDKSGNVLWGLMGAFGDDVTNPYVPVASSSQSVSTTASGTTVGGYCRAVGCYYHSEDKLLSLFIDNEIGNVYTTALKLNSIYMKAGTRRIYFDSSKNKFFLNGVTSSAYGSQDNPLYFKSSHVLQILMSDADSATILNATSIVDPYIVMNSPKVNEILSTSSLFVDFSLYNFSLSSDGYGIRVSLDGGRYYDLRSVNNITISGVSNGSHVLEVYIIDKNGNRIDFYGGYIKNTVYVSTGVFSDSSVSVLSLSENQVLSSGSFSVDFLTRNIPVGYGLMYSVDGGININYASLSAIPISGLSFGSHSIRLFIADSQGVVLSGMMTDVTVNFVVGNRNNAQFSVVVGGGSIIDIGGLPVKEVVLPIDIVPVRIANVYSPVDVHMLSSDYVVGDLSAYNVLVAKVGTPSYLNYSGLSYRDGFSIVEFDKYGSVVTSDNSAVIASNKDFAKTFLGGVNKYGGNELFIADPYGNRALIVEQDISNKTSSIIWEYQSDRIVSDFNRVPINSISININDSGLSSTVNYVRLGATITWYNNTNETVRILSGKTNYNQFYADPDFSYFGSDFDSGDILPGQFFSAVLSDIKTYDYFVFPFIWTGTISSTNSSLAQNDYFILAENDQNKSAFMNRVIKIDVWGNIVWSFGESYISLVKDAKPISETEIVITV